MNDAQLDINHVNNVQPSPPGDLNLPLTASQAENCRKLRDLVDSFRTNLFANIIVNKGTCWLLRKDTFIRAIIFTLPLTFACYLIYLIPALLVRIFKFNSLLFNPAALLLSFLTAFSFVIIKLLFDRIMPPNEVNHGNTAFELFPKSLCRYTTEETDLTSICNWFRGFLSKRRQWKWSLIIGGLGGLTLCLFDWFTTANYSIAGYVSVFLCFFAIGHGSYCAIVIPTLIRKISRARVQLFWLSPADTPWIRDASFIFTKLSLADALIATFCILGLYLFAPLEVFTTQVVAGVWLFITVLGLLYTFFYPHHYLTRAIKNEKRRQMSNLQRLIGGYEKNLLDLNEAGHKKLSELVKLHEQLSNARGGALNIRGWLSLIPSLGVPIITFLAVFFGLLKQLRDVLAPTVTTGLFR